jgi:hypothetical protein
VPTGFLLRGQQVVGQQVVEMTDVVGPAAPANTASRTKVETDRRVDRPSAALAGVVFVAYMVGAGRSFGYDASVTVDQFIRGGSPYHAFTNAYALNNHVAFSILESVVWRLGGQTEVALRVLPVLFAAICVYVIAAWTSRRHGALVGFVSGLVVAATPLAVEQGRDVRGYSLAMLCMTGAVLLIVNEMRPAPGGLRLDPASRGVCVSCLLGLAIGSHLFSGLALTGVVPWIVAADPTAIRRWRAPILRGVLFGVLIYLPTLKSMVVSVLNGAPGHVQPGFPLKLGRELLAVVLVVGAATTRPLANGRLTPGIAATLGLVVPTVVLWIVLHPSQLFPRFFVWLVPAVAVALAAVVGNRPVLAIPALIAAILMIATQAPSWTTDPLPNRQIADALHHMKLDGHICAVGTTGEPLMGYDINPVWIFRPSDTRKCAVLLGPMGDEHTSVARAAAANMPYHRTFGDTTEPGFLLSTVPIADR